MEQFLEVIQSWVNVKGEPYKHAFIMDNQGRGNITVEIYKDDFGSKFGYIANLWVKGEYRKCGLGDLLLKRAEEIAKDNGCEYVELDWAFRNSRIGCTIGMSVTDI